LLLKPLFTIHAGEFLVGCEIERRYPRVNVWVPGKDTGIDLLVTNHDNTKTVSLQVKFSRDYLVTNPTEPELRSGLRAGGWWTPTPKEIENSRAQYWVFVLLGLSNKRSTDFIIVKPGDLFARLTAIHGSVPVKFHIYFWATKSEKCWETRNLGRQQQMLIAKDQWEDTARDFSTYLNNWMPISALNG
jgi:hypothetical protein